MRNRIPALLRGLLGIARDQRGISGIETAIILISVVIVGSVFAVTTLNTGMISSQKAEKTVTAGMDETSGTMVMRGVVFADANVGKTAIDTIKFTLTSASDSSSGIDLSNTSTVVSYLDSGNSLACTGSGSPICSWATNWVTGSSDILDPGERVEITVTISNLSPLLGRATEFTIQVVPNKGAVVVVNRTIPVGIQAVMDLN
jgi:flagellin-like protein